MLTSIKEGVRTVLQRAGYSIRSVGTGVSGVDLLHDARVVLGDSPGQVLFDVGANVGHITRRMLATFPSADVYAFEPSPATCASLRETFKGASRVTVEAMAMGERATRLPFHVTEGYSVNDSLLQPQWPAGGSIVEVPVETVTGYCQARRITQIGLLKIDTQGYDLNVLKGARGLIENGHVTLYSCEVNFPEMYVGQATMIDLLTFAGEVGCRLVGVYEQTYFSGELGYCDLLFRTKSPA